MSRTVISRETDPYFNIAAEQSLMRLAGASTSLFLWRNRPSVIVGRNQNIHAECDLRFLKSRSIAPVRRFSGGGAVFHDLGNVNFTFLCRESAAEPSRYLGVIRHAVGSLGVDCSFSSRNDLIAGGRKFSGHAYYCDRGQYLYHGTIMVKVDLDLLSAALHPSQLKLRSKGIPSVRSRVVNLSQLDPAITTERVMKAVLTAFRQEYGITEAARVFDRRGNSFPLERQLRSDAWIYGESPDFALTLELELPFGHVTVAADIAQGRIARAKIYTDSLAPLDFRACEQSLEGLLLEQGEVARRMEQWYRSVSSDAQRLSDE